MTKRRITMALFGKAKHNKAILDVIRCDEPSYLIWKWRPSGLQPGDKRENAIRWGSSLRVKDGEVAVFVYSQNSGINQDYIEGPFDEILETDNLPVLSSIIGLAYNGDTPFQAEVYFINLARIAQIPFAVPYFDLYDPRYPDFGIPTAVRGKITFNITDYREFIKLHRLIDFDLNKFQRQIRDAMARYVKGIVSNIPIEKNIPVVQIERMISDVNEEIEAKARERIERDFGVNITAIDINAIEIDKTSEGYLRLKSITQDLTANTAQAQAEINIKNMKDVQRINSVNMEETMRIQREEAQYAQHKQTQTSNLAAFQMEQQAAVGIAGAEALGNMGINGATEITGSGGMNPAAMMTGMAMGGVIGQNVAGMMNNVMQNLNNSQQGIQPTQTITPPPVPVTVYHVAVDGQATGPFNINALSEMVSTGTIKKDTLVWKQGMENWEKAGNVDELCILFESVTSTTNIPPIPEV